MQIHKHMLDYLLWTQEMIKLLLHSRKFIDFLSRPPSAPFTVSIVCLFYSPDFHLHDSCCHSFVLVDLSRSPPFSFFLYPFLSFVGQSSTGSTDRRNFWFAAGERNCRLATQPTIRTIVYGRLTSKSITINIFFNSSLLDP